MTHPTKALFNMVMHDFMRVGVAGTTVLFTETDLHSTMAKIETIDYHQEMSHKGIKFKCYNAGHVLGVLLCPVLYVLHPRALLHTAVHLPAVRGEDFAPASNAPPPPSVCGCAHSLFTRCALGAPPVYYTSHSGRLLWGHKKHSEGTGKWGFWGQAVHLPSHWV